MTPRKNICPFCGSRIYRSSRSGKQVYKCNDLTDSNCVHGRKAIARTKHQIKMLHTFIHGDVDE